MLNKQKNIQPRGAEVSLEALLLLRKKAKILNKKRDTHLRIHNQTKQKLLGQGLDFSEVRAYQPGENAKHIHWKITSKKDKPHIKLFHEELDLGVYIVLDLTDSMFFGTRKCFKSVFAAYLASLLIFEYESCGYQIGCLILDRDGPRLSTAKSKQSLPLIKQIVNSTNKLVERVTQEQNYAKLHHKSLSNYFRSIAQNGVAAHVISDFRIFDRSQEQNPLQKQLVGMSRDIQLNFLCSLDSFETNLPTAGNLQYYSQDEKIQMLHTSAKTLQQDWAAEHQTRMQHWQSLSRQNRISWKLFHSNEPLELL